MSDSIRTEADLAREADFISSIIEDEIKLRDQFAIAALPTTFERINAGRMTLRQAAVEAYNIADMMMEIRSYTTFDPS
tara:strand:+ start:1079 stop:1312 length:234 start_codon:yes stop_codon:yes gene_type:complete